jgi:folate-binding Fe-S cluster repair protein YgfZ
MTETVPQALIARDRAVLRLGGAEVRDFLQGLVSNDVRRIDGGAVYAALLTPQGKYLFDFFLIADGADVLIDVAADRASALAQRLALYRLRRPVTIAAADLAVVRGLGPAPATGLVVADPRHPALGWRAYGPDPEALIAGCAPLDPAELTRRRIEHGVPRMWHRTDPRRELHPRDGLRAAERRRFPQGLLRRAGGDRADEAQDRAAQGARPRRDLG